MENQIIDDSFGMTLNDQMRTHIQEIAKWSYFLSIIGFIGIGFMVLAALFAGVILGSIMSEFGDMGPMGAMGGGFISILYLSFALLYFFPVLYLFRFASKAKLALRSGNDADLTDAFGNLKSHYKFLGILTIVVLALYALIFVFAGLGGMMM